MTLWKRTALCSPPWNRTGYSDKRDGHHECCQPPQRLAWCCCYSYQFAFNRQLPLFAEVHLYSGVCWGPWSYQSRTIAYMTFATQTVKHKGNKSISLKSGIEENRRNCGIERRGHKQCKESGSEKSRSVGRKRMGQSEDDFQQGNWRFHCEIRPAITLSTTIDEFVIPWRVH